jgi:hypothetical protein
VLDVLGAVGVGLLVEHDLVEEEADVVDHGELVVAYFFDQPDLLVLVLQADLLVLEEVVYFVDLLLPPLHQLHSDRLQLPVQLVQLLLRLALHSHRPLLLHLYLHLHLYLSLHLHLLLQVVEQLLLLGSGQRLHILLQVDGLGFATALPGDLLEGRRTSLYLLFELLVEVAFGLGSGDVELVAKDQVLLVFAGLLGLGLGFGELLLWGGGGGLDLERFAARFSLLHLFKIIHWLNYNPCGLEGY